jgi:hypothetical protein
MIITKQRDNIDNNNSSSNHNIINTHRMVVIHTPTITTMGTAVIVHITMHLDHRRRRRHHPPPQDGIPHLATAIEPINRTNNYFLNFVSFLARLINIMNVQFLETKTGQD